MHMWGEMKNMTMTGKLEVGLSFIWKETAIKSEFVNYIDYQMIKKWLRYVLKTLLSIYIVGLNC